MKAKAVCITKLYKHIYIYHIDKIIQTTVNRITEKKNKKKKTKRAKMDLKRSHEYNF